MSAELTYEELQAKAAAEWQKKSAIAGRQVAEWMAQIQRMPDVLQAPEPGTPWAQDGIVCPACKSTGFTVPPRGWVTVNGHRHRTTLICLGCKKVDTWDWSTMAWLGMA